MDEEQQTKQIEKTNDVASATELRKLIHAMRVDLDNRTAQGKATVADFIKLVQMYRELEDTEIEEIRVTWVRNEPSNET